MARSLNCNASVPDAIQTAAPMRAQDDEVYGLRSARDRTGGLVHFHADLDLESSAGKTLRNLVQIGDRRGPLVDLCDGAQQHHAAQRFAGQRLYHR
jgi:hypothetical protein